MGNKDKKEIVYILISSCNVSSTFRLLRVRNKDYVYYEVQVNYDKNYVKNPSSKVRLSTIAIFRMVSACASIFILCYQEVMYDF